MGRWKSSLVDHLIWMVLDYIIDARCEGLWEDSVVLRKIQDMYRQEAKMHLYASTVYSTVFPVLEVHHEI